MIELIKLRFFRKTIRRDLWSSLQNVIERLSRIDALVFLTNDVIRRLTSHFEKVRLAQQRPIPTSVTPATTATTSTASQDSTKTDPSPVFQVFPHLMSKEREQEYLTKLAEVLVSS